MINEQEIGELNQALRELRDKVADSVWEAQQATYKLGAVINNSNLKSTLTLLDSDIALRRLLELHR